MLHNQGLRETPQRTVILDELRRLRTHPTADEVYRLVRRRLPRISLGTVYRNLELLAERGVIRKLEFAGGRMRFDGNPRDHYHVRCLRCGRVDDIEGAPPARLEESFRSTNGYKIIGCEVELVGLCPQCQREETDADGGSTQG